jgi:cytochrome c oxidase subunit II
MIGEVIVMSQEDFAYWLDHGVDGSMAAEGRKLFRKLQCVTCHHEGGRAPLLERLYEREVTLRDGRRVVADDAYLRESIVHPDAKIVVGYQAIMPTYAKQVNEEELLQLIAFIKGLGPGETPQRTEGAEPP